MAGHVIEALLITDKNSNPRFYMQLDPRAFGMDPILASSFFTAIDMFSKEVFQQSAPVFHVDYGAHIFTVLNGETAHMIAVGVQRLNTEIIQILDALLREFEDRWLPTTEMLDSGAPFVDAYLEPFGESVMMKLSFDDLPDSWVPYFTVDPNAIVTTSGTLVPIINGSRNMKEILEVSGLSKRDLYLEISKLWAHRVIRFRNTLSFNDFVATRSEFFKYVQATSREIDTLKSIHPEMITIIPRLAGLMDGRRSVREILVLLGSSYDEREILRVLDYLLENGIIEALSPEKRRILLVKEVLELSLRIAEECYHRDTITKALASAMKASDAPESISQLRFTDNHWSVDFGIKVFEGLNNRRLMLIFGEWMKILAQFSAMLDPIKLDSFIKKIAKAFSERVVNRFAPFDLRGFEEFSFWLEQLSSPGLSQVRTIKTGSLKPSGENPVEELIFTLVTRGQAIYGTERVTRICAAANIPLMDIPPDYWVDWQKNQSLQRLLIEYAKIGSAAKFTLLVLVMRVGLTLPQSITFD
ncbi:hypothetical protein EU527_15430 [Candidatus Thorarchaeota archaeon]|nr:MAG: hypothetical protein EU527_15430 [Candidatus Thorarchaeota archaeon]